MLLLLLIMLFIYMSIRWRPANSLAAKNNPMTVIVLIIMVSLLHPMR